MTLKIIAMPGRELPQTRGERRSRLLRLRLAEDLTSAREAAGLSVRGLARQVGVSHTTIARLQRGDVRVMTVDLAARAAEVLGQRLMASLYPNGDPVRDRGHLALLERLRRRISPGMRWRVEVPIPIAGDPRSGDAMLWGQGWEALVEAETRLRDVQLVQRRAAGKQRDLGASRLILLVSDTLYNREVIKLHPELRVRFPIGTRSCLARLARGQDPGGDCLVVL